MMIRSCSKRLLALALAVLMVCSTVLPAAATNDIPCTLTEGCTLTDRHEGDCDVIAEGPETTESCTITEGCTLSNGHEGDCDVIVEGPETTESCTITEGCTLGNGHDGDCDAIVEESQELEPDTGSLIAMLYDPSEGTFRNVTELKLRYDPATFQSEVAEVAFALGTPDSYSLLSWDSISASAEGAVTYGVNYYDGFDTLTITTYDLYGYNFDGSVTVSAGGHSLTIPASLDEPGFTEAAVIYAEDSEGNRYSSLDFGITFGTQVYENLGAYRFVLCEEGQEFYLDSRHCDSTAQDLGYLNRTEVEGKDTYFYVSAMAIGCGDLKFTYYGTEYTFPINGVYSGPISQDVYHMTRNWHNNRNYNFLELEYDADAQTQKPVEFSFVLTDMNNSVFLDGEIVEIQGPVSIGEARFEGNGPNAPAHFFRTATATGTGEACVFVKSGDTTYSFWFNCIEPLPLSLYASEVGRDNLTNNPNLYYEEGVQRTTTFKFRLGNTQSGNFTNINDYAISVSGPLEIVRTEAVPDSDTSPAYVAYTLAATGIGTGTITYVDNTDGTSYTMTVNCVEPVPATLGVIDLRTGLFSDSLTFVYDKGTGYSKPLRFLIGNDQTGRQNITDEGISVAGPLEIIAMNFQEDSQFSPAFMEYVIVPTGTGRGTITYTRDTDTYTMDVDCMSLEDYPRTQLFGATPSNNQINPVNPISVLVREGPPMEFALLTSQGEFPTFLNDPSCLTWDETLNVEPMYFYEGNGMGYQVYGITCTSFAGGNIYYTDEFGRTSSLWVNGISVDDLPAKELCLTATGAFTPQDSLKLVANKGETLDATFFWGNFQTEDVENVVDQSRLTWGGVVELTYKGKWDGWWPEYTISVTGKGEGWIQYVDPATGQSDKLYVYGIEDPIQATKGDLLFTRTAPNDCYPATYSYFGPGDNGNPSGQTLYFYFGQPGGTAVNLNHEQLTATGPITIEGGYYNEDADLYAVNISAAGFGKGTIEYTFDHDQDPGTPDMTYCYLVTAQEGWAPSWEADGPGNGITVKYGQGNSTVTVGIGSIVGNVDGSSDNDTLGLIAHLGPSYNGDDPSINRFRMNLVALEDYGTNTQEVAPASFYNSIRDVSFDIYAWTNSPGYEDKTIPTMEEGTRQTNGISTWYGLCTTDADHAFTATLIMQFTLDLDGTPRRYTMTAGVDYRLERSVTICANDLDTAAKLNTVLANMQIMENWLRDRYPEEYASLSEAGDITIVLPAVTYDQLIVQRAPRRAPLTDTVQGLIHIQGSEEGGNRTTMPGLLSTASTGCASVTGIDFAASENITMTYGKETFTCGIMVDALSETYAAEYDLEYLAAYDKRYDGSEGYIPNPRAGNEWFPQPQWDRGGSIGQCSFTGFDYAMRSVDSGYTGHAWECTFTDNEYAIYIDSAGVGFTGTTNGALTGLFYDNVFRSNRTAVCIRNRPADMTPYDLRFFDNIFLDNHKDFKVTTSGNKHYYYFYRNYYSGKNQDTVALMTLAEEETFRGAFVDTQSSNAVILSEPCRTSMDMSAKDNLWIFGDTGILNEEADSLRIPQEALTVNSETEISVIDSENNTLAVWTFTGGAD